VFYWSGFLFFFDCDHFAAFVLPATGTDGMRQAHPAAVRASGQVRGLQRIMCAAAVTTAFRMFTLWLGCHQLLLYDYSQIAGRFVLSPLIIAAIPLYVKKKSREKK
jgi:hypothetical protein